MGIINKDIKYIFCVSGTDKLFYYEGKVLEEEDTLILIYNDMHNEPVILSKHRIIWIKEFKGGWK